MTDSPSSPVWAVVAMAVAIVVLAVIGVVLVAVQHDDPVELPEPEPTTSVISPGSSTGSPSTLGGGG
ncbi:hypothetical protein ACFQ0K_08365 [Nocardioides caeni]|uniref:Uncharacterized protein n=1 Tax=Nocardioides caeni TaxID=574700 RepID=A0A4S8N304_9ACTN|nr:hypothetical protein [Nocardioides caeni]THV10135.1 hypothetical protein E9934_15115 [Nocardioides caeni]